MLDCHTPWGDFAVELTMGVLHVYFPDEAKWKRDVPALLQEKWPEVVDELRRWCEKQKIPLSIVSDAWIELPHAKKA
jgi:hypothetical protein